MKATIRIVPWHVGHASGSTSKICCTSSAQRRGASVGVRGSAATRAGGATRESGSDGEENGGAGAPRNHLLDRSTN